MESGQRRRTHHFSHAQFLALYGGASDHALRFCWGCCLVLLGAETAEGRNRWFAGVHQRRTNHHRSLAAITQRSGNTQ